MTEADLRNFSSRTTVAVAFCLVVIKLLGWVMTGSVALLTSAMDGLVDAGASLVTLLGIRYAQRPPDQEHRFGHGKGEAVAAFTQAMFLAGAALVLAFESIQRLVFPEPLNSLELGLWVISISTLAALGLTLMQTWVLKRTN